MALHSKEFYRNLFSNSDWNLDTLRYADELCEHYAKEHLNLDIYANHIEVVTSEQLLDAMSLIGLPISYPHWSFGKQFALSESGYKQGYQNLSYEMVINSNPCISYNVETNTTCLMVLVIAHAAMGHNAFFKNNYMFQEWTQADAIVGYMKFARDYIMECEEKYGYEEVEGFLDACHALQYYGIDRYKKPKKMSPEKERKRFKEALEYERKDYNPLWETLPERSLVKRVSTTIRNTKKFPQHPEENILYFLQKNTPDLPTWKREIIRIVRKTAQYFYPQVQTKVINEGTACVAHYHIIHKMYEDGYLPEGFMQEFFTHHSNVIFQPTYRHKGYYGLNPYTLGFNIFQDIKRMCEDPTEEDKHWFPDVVGKDWVEQFNYIYKNFRDDSFILQYLSPKVIREMKLFTIEDSDEENRLVVDSIHNERGYKRVRESLSRMYDRSYRVPNIQVAEVDVKGDRCLSLNFYSYDGIQLEHQEAKDTLECIKFIWGYRTKLTEVTPSGGRTLIMDLIQ